MAASAPQRSVELRVGNEIANAWGWLLARAPRVAKALEAMPGAPAMMASVLAGIDLFHRRYGVQPNPRELGLTKMDVSYNEATDTILIRLSRT
jgi:hypothetical protein